MKIRTLFFALISFAWIAVSCEKDKSLTVSGIEFKPNFFLSDGKVVGVDADIARQALDGAGVTSTFVCSDTWDEAYQATLNGPGRALLTVGYTKERQNKFKWAGPTSKSNYVVFAKASTGIGVTIGRAAAKEIESIAVIPGWLETTILEEEGFHNLRYFNTYDEAISAFKNDEVKAIASDGAQFLQAVSYEYYLAQKINIVINYHNIFYFIAFSKDVDDEVVKSCQRSIDAMVTSGALADIYRQYVSYAEDYMIPGTLQIMAELNPPYNYYTEINGASVSIAGSSIELVNEMQARNSYQNVIELSGWTSSYELLQYMPNCALITTARTPERENLFQWVGPIASLSAHFYTKAGSGIQLTTIDQAKALNKVATPLGWYTHDFLTRNGFTNILVTAYTPEQALDQLLNGVADALLMSDNSIKWYIDKKGIPQSSIIAQLEIDSYKGYMAFSLNTSQTIVAQWQSNLDAMRADGRFKTIWDKWYQGIILP